MGTRIKSHVRDEDDAVPGPLTGSTYSLPSIPKFRENGTEKLDEYWGSNKVVEYDTKGKIIKNKAPRSSLGPASGSKKVASSAGSSASPAIKRRKIEDEEVDDEVSFSKKSRQSDAPSSAKRKRIIAAEESEEELEDIVVPKKAPANGSAAKSTTNGTAAKTKGRKSVDADDKPVSAARKKGRPSASAKKEGGRKSGSAPSVEMDVEVGGDEDDYGTDVEVVDIEEEMGNRKNWDVSMRSPPPKIRSRCQEGSRVVIYRVSFYSTRLRVTLKSTPSSAP